MSPIGEKILSYYPTQNYPGTVNNYVAGTGGKYRYEQPMGRWDHTIDDSNHLYTLFTFQDGSEYRNQTGIPGPAAVIAGAACAAMPALMETSSKVPSPRLR